MVRVAEAARAIGDSPAKTVALALWNHLTPTERERVWAELYVINQRQDELFTSLFSQPQPL